MISFVGGFVFGDWASAKPDSATIHNKANTIIAGMIKSPKNQERKRNTPEQNVSILSRKQ